MDWMAHLTQHQQLQQQQQQQQQQGSPVPMPPHMLHPHQLPPAYPHHMANYQPSQLPQPQPMSPVHHHHHHLSAMGAPQMMPNYPLHLDPAIVSMRSPPSQSPVVSTLADGTAVPQQTTPPQQLPPFSHTLSPVVSSSSSSSSSPIVSTAVSSSPQQTTTTTPSSATTPTATTKSPSPTATTRAQQPSATTTAASSSSSPPQVQQPSSSSSTPPTPITEVTQDGTTSSSPADQKILIPLNENGTTRISSEFIKQNESRLPYPLHKKITKMSTPYYSHIGTPIVTTSDVIIWTTPPGPLRIFEKMTATKTFFKKHKGAILDIKEIVLPRKVDTAPALTTMMSVGSQDGTIVCWVVSGVGQPELSGGSIFQIYRSAGMFRKFVYSKRHSRAFALAEDGCIIHFDCSKCIGQKLSIENDEEFFASPQSKQCDVIKLTLPMILGCNTPKRASSGDAEEDEAQNMIVDVALSADEQNLLVLTHDSSIVVYNWKARLVLQTIQIHTEEEVSSDDEEQHVSDPFSINQHDNLAIVGLDQNTTIAIVDITTGQQQTIELPHENDESYHIHVNNDIQYMVISNRNGNQCYIYDFKDRKTLYLVGIRDGVFSCVAEQKGDTLGIFCLQPAFVSFVQINMGDHISSPIAVGSVSPKEQIQAPLQQQQQAPQPVQVQPQPQPQPEKQKMEDAVSAEELEQSILKSTRQTPAKPTPQQPQPQQQKQPKLAKRAEKPAASQQSQAVEATPQIMKKEMPVVQPSAPTISATEGSGDYLTRTEFNEALGTLEARLFNNMATLMNQYFVQMQQFHQQTVDHSNKNQIELLKTISSSLTTDLPEDLCEMMNQEIVPRISGQSAMPSDLSRVVGQSVEHVMRSEVLPVIENLSHRITGEISKLSMGGVVVSASPVQQMNAEELLKKEVDDLIEQGEFTKALGRALSGSNLPNLLRVLPKFKLDILSDLDQPVLLSLVQQLAYDLSLDEFLKLKMEWLEQCMLGLETTSDVVVYHGADILNTVSQNLRLAIQQMDQCTPDKRGESGMLKKRMKLMMHVIQNLLADIRS